MLMGIAEDMELDPRNAPASPVKRSLNVQKLLERLQVGLTGVGKELRASSFVNHSCLRAGSEPVSIGISHKKKMKHPSRRANFEVSRSPFTRVSGEG